MTSTPEGAWKRFPEINLHLGWEAKPCFSPPRLSLPTIVKETEMERKQRGGGEERVGGGGGVGEEEMLEEIREMMDGGREGGRTGGGGG